MPPLAAALAMLLLAIPVAAQAPSAAPSGSVTPACAPLLPPSPAPDRAVTGDLTIFGAASLTGMLEALREPWTAAHPGSTLVLALDASSTLRTQIEQGAPADAFASADLRNAQLLVDACLAPGPVTPFARNDLVIIVPADDPAAIASPADLARPGVRLVTAGPEVPITRYTTQVVANLAALTGDPDAYLASIAANTVSEEDNVKAIVAKIELGEGDAGIVYRTDAVASSSVRTVEIPAEANVIATYGAVVVGASDRPAAAAAFLDFLRSPAAQAVMADLGFLPAP